MSDYKWNNKKIESIQNQLKTQVERGDKIAKQDLRTLKSMLGIQQDPIDSKANDIIFLEVIEKIKELAKTFYQKKLIKNSGYDYIPPLTIGINEYLELVHDFYKTCSPTFYNLFMEEYSKKNTNLQINYSFHDGAIAYHFLTLQESFIQIFMNNTVLDLVNLPHEYGHAITFLKSNSFTTNPNFLFIREMDGYYFQMKFLNYLIENNILREEATIAKISTDYFMYNKALHLVAGKFDLKKAVSLFSYMASIELCMQDNQEADDLLEKIIKKNPQTIMEGIETLKPNIVVGKSLDNYQKVLKRQLSDCFNN